MATRRRARFSTAQIVDLHEGTDIDTSSIVVKGIEMDYFMKSERLGFRHWTEHDAQLA